VLSEAATGPLEVPEPVESPEPPELPAGEVHVWHASMAGAGGAAVLPAEELDRAGRLRVAEVRSRFVRSRALLRTVLAGYCGVRARELRFGTAGQGKPFLAGPRGIEPLRFNLSRTDVRWLLAVSRDREVGVDVERLDRQIDVDRLAARLFSRREQETLGRLAAEKRKAAFFRAWACREATVKAMGEGMFSHAGRFEVEADPERAVAARPVDGAAFPWRLGLVPVPADHVGVLATEGEPARIRAFRAAGGDP
jgi:4'-phosphopantetheinyl transferase